MVTLKRQFPVGCTLESQQITVELDERVLSIGTHVSIFLESAYSKARQAHSFSDEKKNSWFKDRMSGSRYIGFPSGLTCLPKRGRGSEMQSRPASITVR